MSISDNAVEQLLTAAGNGEGIPDWLDRVICDEGDDADWRRARGILARRIESYAGGDRAPSPPVGLLRALAEMDRLSAMRRGGS